MKKLLRTTFPIMAADELNENSKVSRLSRIKRHSETVANRRNSEITSALNKIHSLSGRIQECLELANACVDAGIDIPLYIHNVRPVISSASNGDRVGLMSPQYFDGSNEFRYIGFHNGVSGFCTDGNDVISFYLHNSYGTGRLNVFETKDDNFAGLIFVDNFVTGFNEFEQVFLSWIDELEVDGEL